MKSFVGRACDYGLTYLQDGSAQDMVVVDQLRGPMAPCDWIEFGQTNIGGGRVVVCRRKGSKLEQVAVPEDWGYENSLTKAHGFVPAGKGDKSLQFLRHEGGLDVYLNRLTGQEVYVARR